jgi:hypothetical protein
MCGVWQGKRTCIGTKVFDETRQVYKQTKRETMTDGLMIFPQARGVVLCPNWMDSKSS